MWWDGDTDQALVESRTPEGASDVSNSGTLGNIHGLTLDEPLAVISTNPSETRIINYNWRGQALSSVFPDGRGADASTGSPAAEVDWPAMTQAETYFTPAPEVSSSNNPKKWLGTFVQNGQGTTGMLYRRNRYFDPRSGRFTQEDPLGIAGGLNAYGFAEGDPINFSDPFGLCPVPPRACIVPATAAAAATVARVATSPMGQQVVQRGSQLARNLIHAGAVRQAGEAAHHIVAKGSRWADPARRALARVGVQIDEAVNGVFLPATRGAASSAANHLTLHTSRYYQAVNRALADVETRQEAVEVLMMIRSSLRDGTFTR